MIKMNNGHLPESTTANNFNFLKTLAISNLEFFKIDKNESGPKFVNYLTAITENLDPLLEVLEKVSSRTSEYDFSEDVKGNGHLSWVKVTHAVVAKCSKLLEEVCSSRASYFFRRDFYLREIISYSEAIESLINALQSLLLLMSWSEPGELLCSSQYTCEQFFKMKEYHINQYCFYGRLIGIQYCDSIAKVLKTLCILMATFSEVYYSNGRLIDPILRGSKYWIDPELRAKRIVNISQYSSPDFCKNFWFLGEMELMTRVVPNLVFPTLLVNKVVLIEPKPLVIQNIYGKEIDIPIPSSHIGQAPVRARLLSSSLRLGMEVDSSSKSGYKFPSDTLLFHCHGGGFIAQSSRSHENYLRQWAIDLDIPILTIDYSLAPEAPYPRALEEVFYAYCWALSNPGPLGTTAQKIIVAGDSAGGNLNVALTMMCLEFGVRPPSGVFLAYIPMMNVSPSPSRILCLIDPLLPFGFILNCCKAYACSPESYVKESLTHERKLRRKLESKAESLDSPGRSDQGFNGEECEVGEEQEDKPTLISRCSSTGIISRWIESLSNKISSMSPSSTFANDEELEKEIEGEKFLPCPFDMLQLEMPKDPYISPYLASDTVISNFPPVSLLTTDLDPFLDDCVHFAKKLRRLGVKTTLDILPGLCHGFLNFSNLSTEANDGSKLCVKRMKDLIELSNQTESAQGVEC